MSDRRPAFYAPTGSVVGDVVSLLHVPYTLWHLSFVPIGAALAATVDWLVLGGTLLAFGFGLGIGAHSLDEVRGRPLGTGLTDRALWVMGLGAMAVALAIAAVGADIRPVPCDSQGLMTSRLPVGIRAALAFVTPSHQYPLGGVLPPARREDLIAWAESSGAYVIEDDYDGEYRYDVKPIPPLHQSAPGRVITARSPYITTVSSTKTESGQSGAGGTSMVSHPASFSAST